MGESAACLLLRQQRVFREVMFMIKSSFWKFLVVDHWWDACTGFRWSFTAELGCDELQSMSRRERMLRSHDDWEEAHPLALMWTQIRPSGHAAHRKLYMTTQYLSEPRMLGYHLLGILQSSTSKSPIVIPPTSEAGIFIIEVYRQVSCHTRLEL